MVSKFVPVDPSWFLETYQPWQKNLCVCETFDACYIMHECNIPNGYVVVIWRIISKVSNSAL